MGGGGGSDPKELESKEALAQQAANALRRYGDVFVPLENMFIDDTKAMFADGASDDAMASAQNQTSARYWPRAVSTQNVSWAGSGHYLMCALEGHCHPQPVRVPLPADTDGAFSQQPILIALANREIVS